MNRLKESVGVFTACIEKNPFFLDGIIARGNVYMDYGNKEGIIYARLLFIKVTKMILFTFKLLSLKNSMKTHF